MGRDKASLAWGRSTLLAHLVAQLGPACGETFVVAAPEQIVPRLPNDVRILSDPSAHEGPLAGVIVGLRTAGERNHAAAFLVGCDAPFVAPAVVEFLTTRLGDHEAAVVEHDGVLQPLLALVRVDALAAFESAWANGERSLRRVLESLDLVRVPSAALRAIDPELRSLININTPEEYARMRPARIL